MKKTFLLAFSLLALIAFSSPAHALQCKTGNFGSDECWTDVLVSASETTPIIRGTIVVYDKATDSADRNAFEVKAQSTSTDSHLTAGVAQNTIATGDRGRVLVRGLGALRTETIVQATGDALYFGKNDGHAGIPAPSSRDRAVAWAAQSTASAATIDAFITVI